MWLYGEIELSSFYSVYCNCDLVLEIKMKRGKRENKNKNNLL